MTNVSGYFLQSAHNFDLFDPLHKNRPLLLYIIVIICGVLSVLSTFFSVSARTGPVDEVLY